MSEWQPIDTAPKDGSNLILCVAGSEESGEAHWNGTLWVAASNLVDGCPEQDIGFFVNPTHWMPLPEPPSE